MLLLQDRNFWASSYFVVWSESFR